MIAKIRRVWAGERRTTIIAIDQRDGCEKACFVWMRPTKGRLIASLCERLEQNGHGLSDQQVVLTVKPRTSFGYEIEDAELVPRETQTTEAAS